MAKRISDTQRIVNFGLTADETALNQAIESLTAIRANRYPKDKRATRKPRADKGSRRTQTPPASEAAAAVASGE